MALPHRALVFTLFAYSATATRLHSTLRLRGGDDADALGLKTKANLGKMSREEIIEKLNAVPTFCIMAQDGSVVSLPDPDGAEGEECCTWFVDAGEARAVYKGVCEANPDEKFRLMSHGLGAAFSMCGGWPGAKADYDGRLRLKASKAFLEPIEKPLIAQMQQEGVEIGEWRLPIFIGEELAQSDENGAQVALPCFLSPYDLKDAYEKVGQMSKEVAARGPKVLEIRMIAKHMMDEPKEFPNPWRAVKFVPSPDAIRLATELAQAAA